MDRGENNVGKPVRALRHKQHGTRALAVTKTNVLSAYNKCLSLGYLFSLLLDFALLDFYSCAGRCELGLDLLSVLLRHLLLDLGRNAFHELLGLHERSPGEVLDDLHHVQLLVAERGHDDIELRLDRFRRGTGTTGTSRHHHHATASG